MGETPESVEATLAKGQKLDRLSKGVVGAMNSVPFGAASRLLDTVPALTAFASGPAMVGHGRPRSRNDSGRGEHRRGWHVETGHQ